MQQVAYVSILSMDDVTRDDRRGYGKYRANDELSSRLSSIPEVKPMPTIETQRVTAAIDGDFVVFLIGVRINAFWRINKWLPVFLAMPRMLRELSMQPELGLMGFRTRWAGRHVEVIQYWRSFDQLNAYARQRDASHLPAWRDFNKKNSGNKAVGIWHETYLATASQHESVYVNMPAHGLAAATTAVPATGRRKTAAGRLGRPTA
ncbi:DUF4188 domain-containing protein [Salinisphaera aquimarina]|uniref:DUF4188 domain-containing protein n=1 Tax=Salinisphaera aquimarina TaxID=2094031 RepID=A0ABV7EK44_9GAMM